MNPPVSPWRRHLERRARQHRVEMPYRLRWRHAGWGIAIAAGAAMLTVGALGTALLIIVQTL